MTNEDRRFFTVQLVLAIAATAIFGYLVTEDAWPHEATPTAAQPLGWSYPFSCCSSYDCREVTSGSEGLIRETPEGYQIASTGEVIPYSDRRLKDSPDGEYHWCSVAGKNDSKTICLFVPPKSG